MLAITDERDHGQMGVCENCKKEALGRHIEVFGWMRESRGFYFICFDCFGPRITWRPRGKHAKVYTSPVHN